MSKYASQFNGGSDQWPSLQSGKYNSTKPSETARTNTFGSSLDNCSETKNEQSRETYLSSLSLNKSAKQKAYNKSQPKPIHNRKENEKMQNPKKVSIIDDGWTTVTKKTSKKLLVTDTNVLPQKKTAKNLPLSKSFEPVPLKEEINESEREEKKKQHFIRKQRIKEDKKRIREEKARELKESLRRDTKVKFISQELINSMSKLNIVKNKSLRTSSQNFTIELSANNSLVEYPTLSGSHNLGQNRKPRLLPRHNNVNAMSAPTKSEASLSPLHNQNILEISNEEEPNIDESLPVKKKVKSRDLINLEIMDLIQLKRKDEVIKKKEAKKREVKSLPKKVKMKGKISEGKKKQMSTLKKNILRQRKKQVEFLYSVLSHGLLSENIEAKSNQALLKTKTASNDNSTNNSKKENSHPAPKEKKSEMEVSSSAENKSVSEDKLKKLNRTTEEVSANIFEAPHTEDFDKEAHEDVLKELRALINPIHNHKFREYCHHMLMPEIDQILKEFIGLLVKFQERMHNQDPIKAKMKRRYYCGFKEAVKHMHRTTCLIIAPNLKSSPGKGCVDELVDKTLSCAALHGVPVIFGLTNWKLGSLCHRAIPTSSISIINAQGAQDKLQALLELLRAARKEYEELISRGTAPELIQSETDGEISAESGPGAAVTGSLLDALKE